MLTSTASEIRVATTLITVNTRVSAAYAIATKRVTTSVVEVEAGVRLRLCRTTSAMTRMARRTGKARRTNMKLLDIRRALLSRAAGARRRGTRPPRQRG